MALIDRNSTLEDLDRKKMWGLTKLISLKVGRLQVGLDPGAQMICVQLSLFIPSLHFSVVSFRVAFANRRSFSLQLTLPGLYRKRSSSYPQFSRLASDWIASGCLSRDQSLWLERQVRAALSPVPASSHRVERSSLKHKE